MIAQAPPPASDSLVMRLIESAGAAIFGVLVSLVTFRTRLALLDKEIADLKTALETQRVDTERRHAENRELWEGHMTAVNRRQAMMLEIVAGIARKVGADHRFSDSLVRFLTEEEQQR